MSTFGATPASVWGKGPLLLAPEKLKEGDKECSICCQDVPASVKFKPCSHGVCVNCMQQLRNKQIYSVNSRLIRCTAAMIVMPI